MSLATPLPSWNLREWDAHRGHDEQHVELVRGVPIVSPGESVANRRVCDRLSALLNERVPSGWFAVTEVELTVSEDPVATVRRPDVIVLSEQTPQDQARQHPRDVAVVAEVVSPTSRERDWMTKAGEYAAAGIPAYLVVDPGQRVLAAFTEPVDHAYTARADDGDGVVDLTVGGESVRLRLDEIVA